MIKVTAIQTGTVQIKAAQATGKPGRSALGRKIDIFRDLKWLPPLPILTFLIEHPKAYSSLTPVTQQKIQPQATCHDGTPSFAMRSPSM